jgi:hypothetical protein
MPSLHTLFPQLDARRWLLAAAPTCIASVTAAAQVTITPALREGDPISGVGNVTSIDNLVVNDSGSWIVEADTDHANADADGVLVKDGVLLLREGDALPLPSGATLDSFDALTLTSGGRSGWNFFLANTGSTSNDSGVYWDTTLVIQESQLSIAPQLSPSTPYIGFFEVKANDANQMLVMASVDDPAIPSSVDRALVVVTVNGAGGLVSEDARYKEGDILPGQTDAVADFGTGPHSFAFNDAGDVMFVADLAGSTATDGAVYRNGTLLAQEGGPSPVAGRNWLTLSTSLRLDLNASGGYVHTGTLDGSTASDAILVKNGAKLVQEGDNLPAIGSFTITGFGTAPVHVADNGSALWYGEWNDPDTSKNAGWFLDYALIVQEGVTQVGGIVLESLSSAQDASSLSSSGSHAIFEGTLAGGISGAFLVDLVTGPVVYCTPGTTTNGCNASISASGNPDVAHASPCAITVTGVEGAKTGLIFYGLARNALPWCSSGGSSFLCVKVPTQRTPAQSSGGTAGSCNGALALDWNAYQSSNPFALGQPWSAGDRADVQAWFRDPPACKTTALSDAVELTYQP